MISRFLVHVGEGIPHSVMGNPSWDLGGEYQVQVSVMSLWSELSPLRDQTRADRVLCTVRGLRNGVIGA